MFGEVLQEDELKQHLENEGMFEIVEGDKNRLMKEYARLRGYERYKLSGEGKLNNKYIFIMTSRISEK